MLNKALKLNEKLFEKDCEVAATRDGFGTGLLTLGEQNDQVVALSADVAESTKNGPFMDKFPERFFNCGVAEQNMAAVGAGLAEAGKTVFISSYATFSPGKNWETIRTTIVYNRANVKVCGHHSGVATGPDGPTHQATEDIASVRAWPGMTVLVPCDSLEAHRATIAAGTTEGPFYLRFTREKTPIVTTEDTPFEIGQVYVYYISEKPQVTIFATGFMVYYALLAAKHLEEKGVGSIVVNVASIKPIDTEAVVRLARETGAIVTCEDHQTMGGLGGLISEILAQHAPLPIELVGLRDTFAESGSFVDLIKKYKMDDVAIVVASEKVIGRK